MTTEPARLKTIKFFIAEKYFSEEYFKKWKNTGLLDGLNNSDSKLLAILFEILTQYKIKLKKAKDVFLPIARICLIRHNHLIIFASKYINYIEKRLEISDEEMTIEVLNDYKKENGKDFDINAKRVKFKQKLGIDPPENYIGMDCQVEFCLKLAKEVAALKL